MAPLSPTCGPNGRLSIMAPPKIHIVVINTLKAPLSSATTRQGVPLGTNKRMNTDVYNTLEVYLLRWVPNPNPVISSILNIIFVCSYLMGMLPSTTHTST